MTSDSTGSQTETYNGDGLRAWKQAGSGTRTYFLYDGDQPVIEQSSSGAFIAANTFGADGLASRRTAGVGTICYLYDERGNVSQRTDSTGAVTGSDLYDAYGTRTGTAAQPDPFGFEAQAGYYTDTETGLILCTHRFYDPGVGRWLTRDPIGYIGGINLYGYCQNDTVNKLDPLGYFCWDKFWDCVRQHVGDAIATCLVFATGAAIALTQDLLESIGACALANAFDAEAGFLPCVLGVLAAFGLLAGAACLTGATLILLITPISCAIYAAGDCPNSCPDPSYPGNPDPGGDPGYGYA